MKNNSRLDSIVKWIGGVLTVVITSILIWVLTKEDTWCHPLSHTMDISGVWLTPYSGMSYNIIQDEEEYRWVIRENYVSGRGTIKGKSIETIIQGNTIVYDAIKINNAGNPSVLFTTHPKYLEIILFRSCDDYKWCIDNLAIDYPNLKGAIIDAIKAIRNPTCPNVIN